MPKRGVLVGVGAVVTALLVVGAWFAPVPYVIREPGPVLDVLGPDVITVTGADVSASTGQLLLTTVEVIDGIDAAAAARIWFDDRDALIPREAIFPPGQSTEQVVQTNQEMFATSEDTAIDVALGKAGRPAGVRVTIKVDEVGGPSAGLMLTLGIIDKLTPADLTGGHVIAGTGQIAADGTVGPIGGITQKLYGADVDWFLVPAANCAEALGVVPPGLTLARVATVDDALLALKTIVAGGRPATC
ncbi:S16 family serine protease [Actinoplanes philippinensis]|uniref:S16 family serine protease n=1 Tax=Actinoplanes philippinensis TaxID=35752 RepID=UPI00340A1CEC